MIHEKLTPGSLWRHKTSRQFYILEDARPLKVGNNWEENGLVNYHGQTSGLPYARTIADWLANFDQVETR